MAGKKSAKNENPEVAPAVNEDAAVVTIEEPQEQETSPREMVEEPGEQEASPGEMVEEPGEQEASPGEMAKKPGEQEAFPGEMVEEPGEQEASPGERVAKPREQDLFSDDILSDKIRMKQEELETPAKDPAAQEEKCFRITCRNNVSEMIGGVMFVGGVGYTRNAYSASWFANKDGYRIDLEE